jgi:hypothetical protein
LVIPARQAILRTIHPAARRSNRPPCGPLKIRTARYRTRLTRRARSVDKVVSNSPRRADRYQPTAGLLTR